MTLFKKTLSLVLVSVLILACSSEDKLVSNPTDASAKDTYVGFSISIPNASSASTRAVEAKWSGRDAIETVDLYLINITKGTVDATSFTLADFNVNGNILTPKKAIKATSGEEVKAYALINGAGFEFVKKYSAVELDQFFSNKEHAMTNFVENAKTTNKKDVVAMTNKVLPVAMKIAPNVTAEEAIKGKNQVAIDVQRIAARGIVTVDIQNNNTAWLIPVLNAQGKEGSKVEVQGITYAVGLSNKALYMVQKSDLVTPKASYDYVPESHSEWADATKGVRSRFDFSGLANPVPAVSIVGKTVNDALAEEVSSQFVLPVTHAAGNYRKGNTTYFEITADFRPHGDFDGKIGYTEDADIYVGKVDGKLYPTEDAVRAKNGDYFTLYKKGKMKYYVWLNPDQQKGAAKTSPTVRNTIYHANITKFKDLGFPTNPLDPTQEINPADATDPSTPLDTVDTYLSVTVKVLDWDVVSNDIEL